MKIALTGGENECHILLSFFLNNHNLPLDPKVAAIAPEGAYAPAIELAEKAGVQVFNGIKPIWNMRDLDLVIALKPFDNVTSPFLSKLNNRLRVIDLEMALEIWPDLKDRLGRRDKTPEPAALPHGDRLLSNILDSLPDAVLLIDKEQKLLWVNARFQSIVNNSELVVGKRFQNPFHNDSYEELEREPSDLFSEVIKTGKPIQYIHFEPGDEAAERYFRIIISPIFGNDGEVEYLVETVRPITEVVKQRRQIEETEKYLRQFIENAYEMITVKNMTGQYLFINQHAAGLFGLTPMDCIGRNDKDIFPERIADILMKKDRVVIERNDHISEEEKITVDDKTHYLETVRFPMRDYSGRVNGVATISRDVTEKKELQKAFVRSEKMAAIGKLAAGVAHEINNPLTGILSFAEELKLDAEEADPDNPTISDFDIIIRETIRCRNIVSGLLEFSRLTQPQQISINLNEVIERCLNLIQKQIDFQDIHFNLVLSEDLPDVWGDPNQIQQVFLNLIINASEAMNHNGMIAITSRFNDDDGCVEADIADNGPGISEKIKSKLFDPFISTKPNGNGLGLSAVQTIMDQHGGKVSFISEKGKGAVFSLRFPVRKNSKKAAADNPG